MNIQPLAPAFAQSLLGIDSGNGGFVDTQTIDWAGWAIFSRNIRLDAGLTPLNSADIERQVEAMQLRSVEEKLAACCDLVCAGTTFTSSFVFGKVCDAAKHA